MENPAHAIGEFVKYVRTCKGDEKGESQVFLDRLFQAFGHGGYKEAGATLEQRLKGKGRATNFADLVWKPRVLVEMKSRGEKLERHFQQARDYWINLAPNRPRYIVLCNFDEFWIYDFDTEPGEPMDRVRTEDLVSRYSALNFMFPDNRRPVFGTNRQAVTEDAAQSLARVFRLLVRRGVERRAAQRFVLQCMVTMFSEDVGLMPKDLFSEILALCKADGHAYDHIGGLFRQMDNPIPARGGRYKDVPYFNGGLFRGAEPIDLTAQEVAHLEEAASKEWRLVNPAVFGALFQYSMESDERHARGAHFTTEADILKVVHPTIVKPWNDRITAATKIEDLLTLRTALREYQVLDPACGSGNFLYVAYRELRRLEIELLLRIRDAASGKTARKLGMGNVSLRQLHGMDVLPFAVELAKVTLLIGKQLARDEVEEALGTDQRELGLDLDPALPLESMDDNIRPVDALEAEWPRADAIIGNPPYQSKNKAQHELGAAYLRRLRARHPGVPGRADYCVYWFRRAHDHLAPGGRAGLVGTNTIRQNESREGGLDHIVANGGTITEAVSTQVWSGDAAVHVSIVNWIKGDAPSKKRLLTQLGDRDDSPWRVEEVDRIGPTLASSTDVTAAKTLRTNRESSTCGQGQTHGHEGFLLDPAEAATLLAKSPQSRDVVFPFLTGDHLFTNLGGRPSRYVIDFHPRDLPTAQRFDLAFKRLQERVLPDRERAAAEEAKRNADARADNPRAKVNNHHSQFLKRWWLMSYPRPDLMARIARLPRYVVGSQVTKRPIFEFVSSTIRPNAALIVFSFADDYSFGILQSVFHWEWFKARCSTLKGDWRYTSETVFESFPWPQHPTEAQIRSVAAAALALRAVRRAAMAGGLNLRDLYRGVEMPGAHPLKDAQSKLNAAVSAAYGMPAGADILSFLLQLNLELAEREARGEPVLPPGPPPSFPDSSTLVSDDCVRET